MQQLWNKEAIGKNWITNNNNIVLIINIFIFTSVQGWIDIDVDLRTKDTFSSLYIVNKDQLCKTWSRKPHIGQNGRKVDTLT